MGGTREERVRLCSFSGASPSVCRNIREDSTEGTESWNPAQGRKVFCVTFTQIPWCQGLFLQLFNFSSVISKTLRDGSFAILSTWSIYFFTIPHRTSPRKVYTSKPLSYTLCHDCQNEGGWLEDHWGPVQPCRCPCLYSQPNVSGSPTSLSVSLPLRLSFLPRSHSLSVLLSLTWSHSLSPSLQALAVEFP